MLMMMSTTPKMRFSSTSSMRLRQKMLSADTTAKMASTGSTLRQDR